MDLSKLPQKPVGVFAGFEKPMFLKSPTQRVLLLLFGGGVKPVRLKKLIWCVWDVSSALLIPQQYRLDQGSQTHLGVRATLQDISPSAGHSVFRDDKMQ